MILCRRLLRRLISPRGRRYIIDMVMRGDSSPRAGIRHAAEKVNSFRWLEHVVNRTLINYPLFSKLDPFFANIRGEERFKKLMQRVKYEWEHFEV